MPHSSQPDAAIAPGFVVLMSLLFIGTVGVVITLALLLSSIAVNRDSLTLVESSQAKALADACAEIALQSMRDAPTQLGNFSVVIDQGRCTYTITNKSATERLVQSSGIYGTVTRKVTVTARPTTTTTQILSWEEVGD